MSGSGFHYVLWVLCLTENQSKEYVGVEFD